MRRYIEPAKLARRFLALEKKLPSILSREAFPNDIDEFFGLVKLCQTKQLYASGRDSPNLSMMARPLSTTLPVDISPIFFLAITLLALLLLPLLVKEKIRINSPTRNAPTFVNKPCNGCAPILPPGASDSTKTPIRHGPLCKKQWHTGSKTPTWPACAIPSAGETAARRTRRLAEVVEGRGHAAGEDAGEEVADVRWNPLADCPRSGREGA